MRVILLLIATFAAFALSAQPQPQEQGGVRFIHGGIGEEERVALAAARPDYNLRLTFAVAKAGNFVADVQVLIADARGREVLRATSEGPLFYARLAPGRYSVSASYGASTHSRNVQVRDKRAAEAYFYWDDPAVLAEGREMEPERERKGRQQPTDGGLK
jgi:hypothetical protein